MTPIPNDMTFPINLELLAGRVTATDEDVCAAMRFALEHFKIMTEPGAIVGLAATLDGQVPIKDRTVATIVTRRDINAARVAALTGDNNDA